MNLRWRTVGRVLMWGGVAFGFYVFTAYGLFFLVNWGVPFTHIWFDIPSALDAYVSAYFYPLFASLEFIFKEKLSDLGLGALGLIVLVWYPPLFFLGGFIIYKVVTVAYYRQLKHPRCNLWKWFFIWQMWGFTATYLLILAGLAYIFYIVF